MNKVRKEIYKEKEVLIVDYSGCRGKEMIDIFEEAKKLAQTESKQVVILNIFDNRTYVSPSFMRHIENNLNEVDWLINKNAIIGLSSLQEWILKGMNLWYKRQIYSFETKEQALEFLVQ